MSEKVNEQGSREVRSFLMARDPSIDRRFRPPPQTRTKLFDDFEEEESQYGIESYDGDYSEEVTDDSGRTSSSQDSDIEAGALVYLRLRPIANHSTLYNVSEEGKVLVTQPSSEPTNASTNKCNMEKHYSFSEIFKSDIGQKIVYDKCVGNKIESEEDFTVMTYGTSGSGKTFTLLGTDDNPGIIPRALENIFTFYKGNIYPTPAMKLVNGMMSIYQDQDTLFDLKYRKDILSACANENQSIYNRLSEIISAEHAFRAKGVKNVSVFIWVSFVEIYNENCYDLLQLPTVASTQSMAPPVQKSSSKIVCNNGKVFIKGLNKVFVKTSEEALKILRYGLKKVTYASTGVNANSSRSHCIFFVDVLKFYQDSSTEQSCYKFCDLAGSERLHKTGNVGSRLKEAQRINTSLMVLGRCLDAANNNKKASKDIIPFRESKLTMLLQTALLGKERLAMIVNLTPTDKYYEENLNVLNFASIAKNIVYKKPVIKMNVTRCSLLMKPSISDDDSFRNNEYHSLLEEIIFLRAEHERLLCNHEIDMTNREQEIRNELCAMFQKTLDDTTKRYEERSQMELNMRDRRLNAEIAALKRKHEEELEDLRDEIDELTKELEEKDEEIKKLKEICNLNLVKGSEKDQIKTVNENILEPKEEPIEDDDEEGKDAEEIDLTKSFEETDNNIEDLKENCSPIFIKPIDDDDTEIETKRRKTEDIL